MKYSILLSLFILSSTFLSRQLESIIIDEKPSIINSIETFFDSWMTGDHNEKGDIIEHTSYLSDVRNDKSIFIDEVTNVGFFKEIPTRKNSVGSIEEINVKGNIKSAKSEFKTPQRLFTDKYFTRAKLASDKLNSRDGYYINWNIDRTQRKVKPSIPITEEEAKTINCYFVKFDDKNRMTSVKYFLSGKPSDNGNYGAFELKRIYKDGMMLDTFKNTKDQSTLNSSGIGVIRYYLNEDGYWLKKEYYDLNNELVENDGVARVELTRNDDNEVNTWVRFDVKMDTVPFYNRLKKTYILLDDQGQLSFMQNRDANGNLKDGEMGVAEVAYKYDMNGLQLSKEFRNENHTPILHPTLFYSRLEYRDFNKYGFPRRFYWMDEKGYPMENGVIEYNSNMSRKKVTYYDNTGEIAECAYGFAYIIYLYDDKGVLVKGSRLNLEGEEILPK